MAIVAPLPSHMGRSWGALRVLNVDKWGPSAGYGMHGHVDTEIVSWVVMGTLSHIDNMGNRVLLRAHEVQVMTAGAGVSHTERNHSDAESLEFVQIWIAPRHIALPPTYQSRSISLDRTRGRLCAIASGDGRDGSPRIWQDACIYAGRIDQCEVVQHHNLAGRRSFVHVLRGDLQCHGVTLAVGDSARVTDSTTIEFGNGHDAEILVIDLPE